MKRSINFAIRAMFLGAAVAISSMPMTSHAQDQAPAATLKVGDAAPPLAGAKWIKGEPVKSFDPGKIYVVEFWATWCGPCREAIPHVTEMQKKYQSDGVTFIGQDVWENDQAAAEPFVQKMGEKMDYRVVMDDLSGGGRGKMAETWMAAAGQNGIPCSFLIDKAGKIAWIGHPMALESVLKQVIAGSFDAKKQADQDVAARKLSQQIGQAMQANDTEKVMSLLDEFQKMNPAMAAQIDATRFGLLMQKKDYDAAYKIAGRIVDDKDSSPQALNEIAWTIATAPGIEKRDLDLADKAAAKAVELTKGKDGAILDTHARVQFEKGNLDKAIELQTKAIANVDDASKAELQQSLEKYKQARANRMN